jgi:hypothetical protein
MEYDTGDYCFFFNFTEPENPVILTIRFSDGKYNLK